MENIKAEEKQMNYKDTHYEQMTRWKHAVIGDSIRECKVSKFPKTHGRITINNGEKITTTLNRCECKDFKNRKKPCVHMMTLALQLGIYDEEKVKAADKIQNLSNKAYEAFGEILYSGYYDEKHSVGKYSKKIYEEIQSQGLIEFSTSVFEYSKFTKDNIIAVIYATFSDKRNKNKGTL